MSSAGTAGIYFIREIASGGMGRVDLVLRREATFRRLSAIKRLRPHLREDSDIRAMFIEEARLAGLINHPNVVGVIDVGEDEEGPYLVMDYVAGVSVAALLRKQRTVPVTVALEIVEHAARGLHAAHELRDHDGRFLDLVHRDVSPQNVLVGYDGVARVADFGIAKALHRTSQRTSTGILKGKLGYVSPEQLRFERIDRRSDLFSLGIVLYELLTGSRLYSTKDSMGPNRILTEPPPDVGAARAGLPPRLVELTYELLAKDREDRPATAEDVAQRLRTIREEIVMVDDEAPRLAPFMATSFGDRAENERTSIADANARLDRGELETWPVRTPAEAAPRRRWRWLPLAAALASLPIGVGIGAWAFGAGAAPERSEGGDRDAVVDVGANEPAGTDPPEREQAAEPAAPASAEIGEAESVQVEPERAVTPDAAPPSAERRRDRRRPRRPAPMPSRAEMSSEAANSEMTGALRPWTFEGMDR